MTDRESVILDTDIGSDIDDAVCLAYLLAQPRCDLLGITTVSGQPRVRASLVDAVCQAANRRDVPIHAGAELGMSTGEVVQPEVPQAAVLANFAHRVPEQFPSGTAVEFLRQTIRARPHQVTLLAIGPMTNLGLLFTIDPEIPRLLKSLVLMCGVFIDRNPGMPAREWNALCDPVATHLTYHAKVRPHLSIGLDVTCKCRMPCQEAKAKFAGMGGPLAVVSAMTAVWGAHQHDVIFHDPLAAAAIFAPQVCTYADGTVAIEPPMPGADGGRTDFAAAAPGAPAPHRIAVTVDPTRFFDDYFGVVGATASARSS